MKKFLSLILSSVLLFSLSTSLSINAAFGLYEKEIDYLETYSLIPLELTEPEAINRAITLPELYAMIIAYSELTPVDTANIKLPYTDINSTDWYAGYIQKAIDLGVLKPIGTSPKLEPTRPLAKREVVTTLFDTLGVGVSKIFDQDNFPFTDLNKTSYFAPYAHKAYELGIVEKTPTIARAAKIETVGEVASMLYQIDKYIYSAYVNQSENNNGNVTITIDNGDTGESYTTTEKTLINDRAFKVFLDIWSNVKNKYYYKDNIDNKDMIYSAIDGMVDSLGDPYTVFTKPDENNSGQILESEYEGIGMSLEVIDNKVTVISPFKGSPAYKAGVKPKDVITKIDGTSTTGMSLEKAVSLIKGKAGTTVKLTIERAGKTLEFSIVRAKVFYKTATVEFLPQTSNGKTLGVVANIEVVTFGDNTETEFKEAIKEITDRQAESKDVLGVVVDLRNNPGGYLTDSITMTGEFFKDPRKVVILEDRDGKRNSYGSNGEGSLDGYKTVVLINEGSASASEIMAGALKDLGRAKLVGTKSYGKGTVQEFSMYEDGSSFKLTVSKWLTPKGTSINKVGITPDVTIERSKDTTVDNQLNEAIKEVLK